MVGIFREIVLFAHIFIAIIWVGGVLFIGWGVYPATRFQSFEQQRRTLSAIMHWVHWPLTFAGLFVILTGVLLGTVFGPIHHIQNVLQNHFGIVWLSALITAVLTLAWGMLVGNRIAWKLFAQKDVWKNADHGDKKPLYKKLSFVALSESVEVVGFMVLLFLMISF